MRIAVMLLATCLAVLFGAERTLADPPFSRTEVRENCDDYNPLKNPYFGDTHVHTRYSLDASTQGTRTTPAQAYRFALGEPLGIQPWTEDGKPLRTIQLARQLDFAIVTDHAELFGETAICNSPGADGYDSWQCRLYRWWPRGAFFYFNTMASMAKSHLGFCGTDDRKCKAAAADTWRTIQHAAETYYDRTASCRFTTFVGYEWTGSGERAANLHRNVIFRNARVPALPISFIDAPSAQKLWHALDRECLHGIKGCDVIAIPHNSNLSAGQMFRTTRDDGSPITVEDARMRAKIERLAEVMQHKGSSECYYGPGYTADELCAFEQLPYDTFGGKYVSFVRKRPGPNSGYLRGVLNQGLEQEAKLGVNPFKLGFVASTDTHIGAPGQVSERHFPGHGGAGKPVGHTLPKGLPDYIEFNPGGLAVIWAEENSRDALFSAMRRRETYGTSGPRIVVRFFGGWDYPANLCASRDFARAGYAGGVPMGGDLPAPSPGHAGPRFAVWAMKDAGVPGSPGTPLQRIQIIKGWRDADGKLHQKVYEVAGNPNNGASVDTRTCQARGPGFDQLCAVWQDPAFDAAQRAWYYARVVQNPTCRWSQYVCVAKGVDCSKPETIGEGLKSCCTTDYPKTVHERAWTSPIWYSPAVAAHSPDGAQAQSGK